MTTKKDGQMIVYLWPDRSWCYEEEHEEALTWKSDDHERLFFPDDMSFEEIEDEVNNYIAKLGNRYL